MTHCLSLSVCFGTSLIVLLLPHINLQLGVLSKVTTRPLEYIKTLVITFHDHPVLGARQNNSTTGSSPDPLFSHEGLAGETTSLILSR